MYLSSQIPSLTDKGREAQRSDLPKVTAADAGLGVELAIQTI
jgi:hypothetical protein